MCKRVNQTLPPSKMQLLSVPSSDNDGDNPLSSQTDDLAPTANELPNSSQPPLPSSDVVPDTFLSDATPHASESHPTLYDSFDHIRQGIGREHELAPPSMANVYVVIVNNPSDPRFAEADLAEIKGLLDRGMLWLMKTPSHHVLL